MTKTKRIVTVCITLLLLITMLSQLVTAEYVRGQETYVKDVKLIYADDIDEAREYLPAGYNLLSEDLNATTGNSGVYICYSTTTDPSEAITDIKVMHESGGFERTNFKSTLDKAIEGVFKLATELVTVVNEFRTNYNKGVVSAVYAKDALNYFRYDDYNLLGDYLISGRATYEELGQMMLICHEDILSAILSLLAVGVQEKSGENWINRLANIDPSSYDLDDDIEFKERAEKLAPILQQFNDIYCYVLGYGDFTYTIDDLTPENDVKLFTEMAENKDQLLLIQAILENTPVGVNSSWGENKMFADNLFSIGLNEPMIIHESYALLDVMTPGQEIMLRLTGPYNFIIGSQNDDATIQKAREKLESELTSADIIPIYDGVNLDMFSSEVALTTATSRSIAAGRQYDIFSRDVDTLKQRHRDVAGIISSAVTIASSSIVVAKFSLPIIAWSFAKLGCSSIAASITAFAASAIIVNIAVAATITFVVAGIVCAIIFSFFLEDIINALIAEDYERSSIPKYMVDETLNEEGYLTYSYYQVVENVRSDEDLDLDTDDNESGRDINANEGYRWMALYTTKRASAGEPIKADFLVKRHVGTTPEGYVNLSMFGQKSAVNLNSYADENSARYEAIYLFYAQDETVITTAEPIYISSILAVNASHEDAAKKKLIDEGYIPFEHDFSTQSNESIYIGYTLTCHATDALKDIRVIYNFNDTGLTFGELSYGAMGKIGNFTLMSTSAPESPAPPITKLEVFKFNYTPPASLGLEPVNEFSGGRAQHLGKDQYCLYFMAEETFTEGPDYLAGIETDVYYCNTFTEVEGYSYQYVYLAKEDKYGNSYDQYKSEKSLKYGEQFFDISLKSYYHLGGYNGELDKSDGHNWHCLSYKYTTTKNPYRAIYGITAMPLNGMPEFLDNISYAGVGHVLSPVEYSSNSQYYSNTDFPYSYTANEAESHGAGCKAIHSKDTNIYYQWHPIHCRTNVENQDITQSFISENQNAMYLAGYQKDKTPLTADDVIFSKKMLTAEEIPENFIHVYSMLGSDNSPFSVTPSTDQAKIGEKKEAWGLYYDDILATIYECPVYVYYRNEKTVKGETVAVGSLREGKYVSGLFIASREELREASLEKNPDLECEQINRATVENALLSSGATTTYNINISTQFDIDDDIDEANYTYLGITRSDSKNSALRDIKLYIAKPGESPKPILEREITYNGRKFKVEYSLVGKVSISEEGDEEDEDTLERRQVYLYVSSHPALGEPITDIKMSNVFTFVDYEPVKTFENKSFITAYLDNDDNDGAEIFIEWDYLLYGNHVSFLREGVKGDYIKKVRVMSEKSEERAIGNLLDAGCTDIVNQDFNAGAGGRYIYIGSIRTDDENEAIYDLMFYNKKNPPNYISGFYLVSSIDFNEGAGGKYIYLYEKRTQRSSILSPLVHLACEGEDATTREETIGGVKTYREVTTNQNDEYQDANQSCGLHTPYIYLIKTFKKVTPTETAQPSIFLDTLFGFNLEGLSGTIFGTGSLIVIGLFLVAGATAGGVLIYKKRKITPQGTLDDVVVESQSEDGNETVSEEIGVEKDLPDDESQ